MPKIKVAILAGGPSVEHEVSLASAGNVYEFIDRTKYEPHFLLLRRDKKLFLGKKQLPFPSGLKHFDVVFNALHGTFGEDGALQKILDRKKIKYTGSGAKTSRLGMDKWESKKIFLKAGLASPKAQLVKNISAKINFPYPFVVKPRNGGSSVDVHIIDSGRGLQGKIRNILKDDEVLVEKYLPGKEFTAGVLDYRNKLQPLPVVEIKPKPKYKFFDYEAKYKTGASEEIVPARISTVLAKKIQDAALCAHKAINAKTYSRSDFMLHNGEFHILEINTLPGLTKNSLVPKAAKAAGISFTELIGILIDSAMKK
jgi:D-alanine-D-alanine ligase